MSVAPKRYDDGITGGESTLKWTLYLLRKVGKSNETPYEGAVEEARLLIEILDWQINNTSILEGLSKGRLHLYPPPNLRTFQFFGNQVGNLALEVARNARTEYLKKIRRSLKRLATLRPLRPEEKRSLTTFCNRVLQKCDEFSYGSM
jgi:hypothetical protein